MTVQCQNCQASKFPKKSKGMCCTNGKVNLAVVQRHLNLKFCLMDSQSRSSNMTLRRFQADQMLPVAPNSARVNVVDACVKKSLLWNSVTVHTLSTNMRVALHENVEDKMFPETLLQIGGGIVPINT
ncbi:DNA repair and recombination protein pif1, mitochondrial [Elysia marginata]|uniref:ATP-dependent DNA helicase n=1 Tax=Elysia marginata TaxID=1093978 RepID=A0AAV4J618_9GAST|nr:DNA repair and recombination protein pif1, mitochondrial [Elysia marginata]